MRVPILMTAALLLAACQPPAATPETEAPAAAADQTPVMPADAPPQEDAPPLPDAASTSCNLDQGADAAQRLVDRCIAVSPATRPPCHADNPCQLIQGEIDRACAQYGPGEAKPAECSA